ncbi:MAG TPA: 7-cyano-7-deazaguanine synthase QueC [Candidatus Cloacimonadota bacterium]|nr:7-cyano-7-deazaguanine synthase QueC [Candidatus Cloacimonadota bacterium]HPT72931.1 7-cyano-7-deazaguanine synthase QueC [Candidatus Cloacimonadota bacterium]
MEKSKAIVLLSGGMDSLVTAAIAVMNNTETYFLHVNYGQRTEKRELLCFQKLVEHYHPAGSLIADISYLKDIGGSSLTDFSLEVNSSGLKKFIPNTYVPFRNAHLLSIAASWGEVIGANSIYIGVVEEDSSGYPDCTIDFINSFSKAIDKGTKPETKIEIRTPVIHSYKSEIVKIGFRFKAPFELSWSCYMNDEVACGVCDSCRLRLKAFKEAGMKDPIAYADGVR